MKPIQPSTLSPRFTSTTECLTTRRVLRALVREARRALSDEEQIRFASQACERALQVIQEQQASRVAVYLTNDGELDTNPLIEALWQKKIEVCLPRLHPFTAGNLIFLAYTPKSTMTKNGLGILEPKLDIRDMRCITELDLIITPLVAFDNAGNRMGMGGGFYDRSLANWQTTGRPLPVGYAHDCQRVAQLPIQHWDVPLPMIITPSQTLSQPLSHATG